MEVVDSFPADAVDGARMMGYWFTYDSEGNQFWLLLDNKEFIEDGFKLNALIDTQVTFDVWHFEGMRFGEWAAEDTTGSKWGMVTMTFLGCLDGHYSWQVESPEFVGPPEGGFFLGRNTWLNGHKCADTVPDPGWWEVRVNPHAYPDTPKQAWYMQPDGSLVFAPPGENPDNIWYWAKFRLSESGDEVEIAWQVVMQGSDISVGSNSLPPFVATAPYSGAKGEVLYFETSPMGYTFSLELTEIDDPWSSE
jgi:hypothetical protein